LQPVTHALRRIEQVELNVMVSGPFVQKHQHAQTASFDRAYFREIEDDDSWVSKAQDCFPQLESGFAPYDSAFAFDYREVAYFLNAQVQHGESSALPSDSTNHANCFEAAFVILANGIEFDCRELSGGGWENLPYSKRCTCESRMVAAEDRNRSPSRLREECFISCNSVTAIAVGSDARLARAPSPEYEPSDSTRTRKTGHALVLFGMRRAGRIVGF
jgi:hypothetical protein